MYLYLYLYIYYIYTYIALYSIMHIIWRHVETCRFPTSFPKNPRKQMPQNNVCFSSRIWRHLAILSAEGPTQIDPPFCGHFISHTLFRKIKFDRGTRGRPRPPTHSSADRSRKRKVGDISLGVNYGWHAELSQSARIDYFRENQLFQRLYTCMHMIIHIYIHKYIYI